MTMTTFHERRVSEFGIILSIGVNPLTIPDVVPEHVRNYLQATFERSRLRQLKIVQRSTERSDRCL